jgi:4-diphosphocytidyl-2-C-methyl-D-erythritol kinase
MTVPRRFLARAHAKINLSLRVGAARTDGYHPLRTVFQSLSLHDTLEVKVRRGPFALTCSDPGVPVDGRNLVTRAANELWAALGRPGGPRGVAMHLTKHIPVQAGLGGGSSDAAAALVALARAWRARITPGDLARIAGPIGADVPYFLVGGTALGLGRGDVLYPLEDLAPRDVVLALPGFGVPTADAYRWFDEDGPDPAFPGAGAGASLLPAWPGLDLEVANDLEPPVARRHPEIASIRGVLAAGGALATAMTGSGSAVFGLFDSPAAARRSAREVAESGHMALVTRTVDRRTCQRVHFLIASSSPRHA